MADQEIIYRIKVIGDDEGKSRLAELTTQLQNVGRQRAELLKIAKDGNKLSTDEANQLERLNEQYVSLTNQKRAYNAEVNRSVKQAAAEVKSLAGMRADLASMRAEYEKLAPASAKGQQLAGAIAKLQQEINAADFATKNFRGNVGNYMGAVDASIQNTNKNYRELRNEIKALQGMSFAGKSDEEIKAINKRIGELKDNMADLAAIQEASGLEFGAALAGSAQVFSATAEGVIGTMNIMGVESEVLGDVQKKMVELIAVTQALGVIEDAMQKKTLLTTGIKIKDTVVTTANTVSKWANTTAQGAQVAMTEAAAVVTGQATIAAKAAAAAQWLWNAAILANPIVAIVAAVAALTAGIYLLVKGESESEKQTKRLNAELETLHQTMQRTKDNQQFMMDYAKAIGMSTERLREMERAHIAVNRAQAWQELNTLIKLGTERTEEQTARMGELKKEIIALKDKELLLDAQVAKAKIDQRKKDAEDRAAARQEQAEAEGAAADEAASRAATAQTKKMEAEKAAKQALLEQWAKEDDEAAKMELEAEAEREKTFFDKLQMEVDAKKEADAAKAQSAMEMFELEKQILEDEMRMKEAAKAAEERNERAKLNVTKGILSDVSSLLDQQSQAFKALASAQALIDTYQAANAAYKSAAEIPLVGFALAPIAAAAAVAAGMANVAKINGIQFGEGGIIEGASHSQGGVPFTVNGNAGFEAEGGEVIINKRSAAMFLPELSRINEWGGGKRFYASGGFVPTMPAPSGTSGGVDATLIVDSISRAIRETPVTVSAQNIRRGLKEVNVITTEGDI